MPALQDFPLSEESTSRIIGREVLAVTAAALLYPLGWIKRSRPTVRRAEQRTVVLVHGYLGNPSCFAALRAYLRLAGKGPTLSFRYRAGDSVEAAAINLKAFLKEHVRGGRIDLVCHSLGGIISQVYLCELGGARRVDRCITLGSPHRGTYNAYWITGRTGRDLRPDSKLLKRLRAKRHLAKRVRFLSIVGGSDNIIIPRVFAAGKTDTVVVPGLGHLGLLFSPTVFKAVATCLDAKLRRV